MAAVDKKASARWAEQKAAYWLHLGNLAAEKGRKEQAVSHYERAQVWHDRMNELLGNN